MVCDIEFVTLATHPKQAGSLFAVGRTATVASQGLYRFMLPTIPITPPLYINCNATGLFAIDTDGINAVATVHGNTATLDGTFNGLMRINLNTKATSVPFAVTGRNDHDDLAVANGAVFLTGSSGGAGFLNRYTLAPQATLAAVPLGAPSVWRLALMPSANALAIADANTYRARMFNTGTSTLMTTMRVPLQVMPVALAVRADDKEVYALNMLSCTVNAINIGTLMTGLPPFTAEPPASLKAYRLQMLNAFTDLGSVLGQYFKDSFCDLFLVEEPECSRDDKVYLGTVQVKGKQVFNISNFGKRHYAKSFRTWGYWLSAVPLLPLVKKLFAKFASSMLVP
jgi:hypothetical protein